MRNNPHHPPTRPARSFAIALAFVLSAAAAPVRADFEGRAAESGVRILGDPGSFLWDNLHEATTNAAPLYVGRRFEISSNLLPALFPFGELNLAGKVQAHREHGYWPQIDAMGGGWLSLPVLVMPGEVKKDIGPSLFGYHLGVTVSESVDPRLRMFIGYQLSHLSARGNLAKLREGKSGSGTASTSSGFDLEDSLPDELDIARSEHFLVLGGEAFRSTDRRLVGQLQYGLTTNRIIVKLIWERVRWNTSITFFPDGLPLLGLPVLKPLDVSFWPTASFQWRF